jgi:hypothetical protein
MLNKENFIKGNVPENKARGKIFVTDNMLEQRKDKEWKRQKMGTRVHLRN